MTDWLRKSGKRTKAHCFDGESNIQVSLCGLMWRAISDRAWEMAPGDALRCLSCLKVESNLLDEEIEKGAVFVVVALRWGDNENHSYNLCVKDNEKDAVEAAESHCDERGGKYEVVVEKFIIGSDRGCVEVYRAK